MHYNIFLFSLVVICVKTYKINVFLPKEGNPRLFTASTGVSVQIPRLEPGLRLKEPLVDLVYNAISSVNALNWLVQSPVEYNEKKHNVIFAEMVQSAQKHFASYVRKVVATSMIVAASVCNQISPTIRRAALTTTAVYSAVGAPKAAFASMFKNYRKLSPAEKLGTTPLFYVCNSGGNPYLQEDLQTGKPDQRIIVYFMSSDDANDYLSEMAQGSPGNVNEFRVMTTSMEKVMQKIQYKKQSRKLGRFPLSTVFRIQPSSRQCENAVKVQAAASKEKTSSKASMDSGIVSVPMFHVKGMVIKRAGGELVAPYYFSLEDLKDDWSKLVAARADGKLPATPKIEVVDFTEVMCLAGDIHASSVSHTVSGKGGVSKKQVELVAAAESPASTKALKTACNAGIVPPRREIEMLRKYYRNEAGMKNEFQQTRILGLT